MAKTQSVAKNKTKLATIINGVILLVLSPFIAPLLDIFQESRCPRNSFGHCTLESRLMGGILETFIPWVILALGLTLIIIGVIQSRKK